MSDQVGERLGRLLPRILGVVEVSGALVIVIVLFGSAIWPIGPDPAPDPLQLKTTKYAGVTKDGRRVGITHVASNDPGRVFMTIDLQFPCDPGPWCSFTATEERDAGRWSEIRLFGRHPLNAHGACRSITFSGFDPPESGGCNGDVLDPLPGDQIRELQAMFHEATSRILRSECRVEYVATVDGEEVRRESPQSTCYGEDELS